MESSKVNLKECASTVNSDDFEHQQGYIQFPLSKNKQADIRPILEQEWALGWDWG